MVSRINTDRRRRGWWWRSLRSCHAIVYDAGARAYAEWIAALAPSLAADLIVQDVPPIGHARELAFPVHPSLIISAPVHALRLLWQWVLTFTASALHLLLERRAKTLRDRIRIQSQYLNITLENGPRRHTCHKKENIENWTHE